MTGRIRAEKPLVLITGATGNIGSSLVAALGQDYGVIGLDRSEGNADFEVVPFDITSSDAVSQALEKIARDHGRSIAAVVHLVAYFDWSGEASPLYDKVNVEGTRNLLAALEGFEVERFIYASTMLVHAPGKPGERIDEDSPLGPRWEYPRSKLQTENVIRSEASMPFTILRLAGVYDRQSAVPTLTQQIARIYERQLESHLYSGNLDAGQSMLHREDMIDAVTRAVDHRGDLPPDAHILIGEPDAIGYDDLQDRIGALIHGERDWATMRVPKPVAKAGAAMQEKLEPVIPDEIDKGEPPFIRPFMVEMADDHYALDVSRARDWLGWQPRHSLGEELPGMIDDLKADPAAWYARNKVPAPDWVATDKVQDTPPESLRADVQDSRIAQHRRSRWAHFLTMALAFWLITQPPLIGIDQPGYAWSEVILGAALLITATLSLSWKLAWARWLSAGIGALVMALPVLFVTPNGAAYLSDTLTGGLIFGLAVGVLPEVGPRIAAREPAPQIPAGWSFNPSAWVQRLPVIALALAGLMFSRYLAAYQMGHVDSVWEPFFAGSAADPRNGTEEIITSSVSEAWPVPDAAVGAYTYMLEILTGIVGSRARWRTMPWLVIAFGLMIVPLGIVSIGFIVIQPIVIGTWSTLALIGAAAMLIQIPYSLDELAASLSYLARRKRQGDSVLGTLLFGGPDEGTRMTEPYHEFERSPRAILHDMWTGAVNLPWTLWLALAIGISFLFTRLTLDASGGMADADHLLGSLVVTTLAVAAAEVTRVARFVLIPLGLGIAIAPWIYQANTAHVIVSVVAGLALAALSFKRGAITERYGTLQAWIR
ncbi:NAD-dependent epimerase/dehydratase family protein [Novosphingobium malaysiense]|uniref:DNA polymerase III subunit epsilon n=1 Tax=Novosphingobium malaysiense TaxID=1348853 RepID=A0A0B1ZP59_9SPHN|nr:NAD-dependent epimerase/dehydratase family protein [Novosphingobium malaysiense]KHK92945.1 DNA polymerase III subunit epsilon [Novosphingobium malaysiense]